MHPSARWRSRPVLSTCLRVGMFLAPIGIAVGTSWVIARAVPAPEGLLALAGWWLLCLAGSTIALIAANRLAHRAMPLAVLLRLSLAFPDEAPSRWRVARRAASVRDLEEKVARARAIGVDDEPVRTAATILELVAAVESHDRATRGHSERVRIYTDLLAEELRLPLADRDRLRWAALLHDVGKLIVPAKVLNKPSEPSKAEWALIKQHPDEGARLIEPLRAWLGPWAAAVSEHHERFDGTGYPRGLSGDDISLGGRMLAVTDSFETMTAMRAYKRPMTPAKARAELVRCAGSHFDPAIVRAFLQVSVKRLDLLSGPLSWLAQTPVLRGIELAASNAARGAGAGLAAGGAALALSVAPPPASLVPPVRQEQAAPVAERPADESPAPDARGRSAADPVIDDGPDPRPSPEPTDPIIEPGRARQPKPAPDPGDDPIVVTAPPGRNPPTPKPSDPPPEEPPGRAIAADARARRGPPTA